MPPKPIYLSLCFFPLPLLPTTWFISYSSPDPLWQHQIYFNLPILSCLAYQPFSSLFNQWEASLDRKGKRETHLHSKHKDFPTTNLFAFFYLNTSSLTSRICWRCSFFSVLINYCISEIIVNDHLNVFLKSVCKYFYEMFNLCSQRKLVYSSLC